jgi:hypothetical protein
MLSGFCGSYLAKRGGIDAQVTSFVFHFGSRGRSLLAQGRLKATIWSASSRKSFPGRMRLRINEDARVEHALRI